MTWRWAIGSVWWGSTPVMDDDDVGAEAAHGRGDDLLHGAQIGVVAGVGRQRHVDRRALAVVRAALGKAAGAGVEEAARSRAPSTVSTRGSS